MIVDIAGERKGAREGCGGNEQRPNPAEWIKDDVTILDAGSHQQPRDGWAQVARVLLCEAMAEARPNVRAEVLVGHA